MKFLIHSLFLFSFSSILFADFGPIKCTSATEVKCEDEKNESFIKAYTLSDEVLVWLAEGLEHLGYVSAYSLAFAFDEGVLLPRDPQRSFKWFQKCATQGDLDCKNNVGWYYRNGHGVDQNLEAAKAWFELAAKQGHVLAQANLADLYYLEDGLALDYEMAYSWYMKAAEQGDPYSQDIVGVFLQRGFGVEPNSEEAFIWFEKAAAQGNTNAYINLGKLYFYGRGVEQSHVTGAEWYRKASLAGDPGGHYHLARAYIAGEGVKRNLMEAVSLLRKAASFDYADAVFELGLMNLEGLGVPFDPKKAVELFVRGAELGDGFAYVQLAYMYNYGVHVPQDKAMATMLYRLGAETEEPTAIYSLAKNLMDSTFPGDYEEGMRWLESAATLENPEAQFHLSTILVESADQADVDRAIELAELSASAGNLGGKSMVAWLNDTGISGLRDEVMVARMYREGAARGDAYSAFQLGTKMLFGEGVAVDAEEGVRLVNLACNAGYEDACRFAKGNDSFHWHLFHAERGVLGSQQTLGWFYERGIGAERDLYQAKKWYTLASKGGDANAKLRMGWFYHEGIVVPRDMNQAFHYALESAKQGNLHAHIVLFDLYREGKGITADLNTAIYWLSLAVDRKHPGAMERKAHLLMTGTYFEKDEEAAFQLYKDAAERGSHVAALRLAMMYAQGIATELSYENAVYWFSMILNSQEDKIRSNATYNLGYLYQEGLGVNQDLKTALNYYLASAELGNVNAQTNLGNLYRDGRGVQVNREIAEYWYSLAAKKRHPEASAELARLLNQNEVNKVMNKRRVTELYRVACGASYGDACERLRSLQ